MPPKTQQRSSHSTLRKRLVYSAAILGFLGIFIGQRRSSSPTQTQASSSDPRQMQHLPASINSFGDSLYNAIQPPSSSSPRGGLFLSPYSISQALGLLYNGAHSSSTGSHQLAQHVFGIASDKTITEDNNNIKLINDGLVALSSTLSPPTPDQSNTNTGGVIFYQANSIWVNSRYTLQSKYQHTAQQTFPNAMIAPITTAAAINDWVSNATQEKIQKMVSEDAVSNATLILINALYFKGIWDKPFQKNNTGPVPFYPYNGQHYDVAMMYTSESGAIRAATFYSDSGGGDNDHGGTKCIAVNIPYQGMQYSAILAMPSGDVHYDEQQKKLVFTQSGRDYTQALDACRSVLIQNLTANDASGQQKAEVNFSRVSALKLYIPRFEVEHSLNLNQPLQAVGITAPFAPSEGDFSQMVETSTTRGSGSGSGTTKSVSDLYVSDVIHKVFVKVDEQGTEAAAATAVIMMRAMPRMDTDELFVKFDRPFVFSVVNNETGLALFVGEVNGPEKWSGV